MASQNPDHKNSLYPEVIDSNPDASFPSTSNPNLNQPSSSSSNLYPTIEMEDVVENLFPEVNHNYIPRSPSAPPLATEDVLIKIPGAILHLIDKQYSVELACGDFEIIRLLQGKNAVAIYARVAYEIQWPLAKDATAVKVDESHYFFSFRLPKEKEKDSDSSDEEDDRKGDNNIEMLSYGLTIASKGQEDLLKGLDAVLQNCSNFSVQKVSEKAKTKGEALDGSVAKEISPVDLKSEEKKELMEEKCSAYWTTLAPNVENYSGTAAKFIAVGSGKLVQGILWCGDVTMERLQWGNEFMKQRMTSKENVEISPETLKRIQRAKRVTKMTEKVANGILSGVVRVSGYVSSSFANSKMGKKFINLLPEEVVLASLDGFSRICDAVEVAGKNVMSTSSTVTTGLVSHRYGEEAAKATSEGLGAAGHALGTAWAAFKLRQALNPKSALKPTSLGKAAAKAAADKNKKSNK
ncbi:hypothetical protein L6164_027618 [Bauhinia variegata]|uniref:Uncharacterized protein n=1 Tax=Bauhinia variegata TaxID=167791 RepID=A0ACB9LTX4_BAUVA|nr:hypothetical protein L6164_027618 [Bauhinia variegata]